jgi:hypothetical protein
MKKGFQIMAGFFYFLGALSVASGLAVQLWLVALGPER